jgi:hypothetical protein
MNQLRVDLTVIEGKPGPRAEIVLEFEVDELEALRLRGEAGIDRLPPPATDDDQDLDDPATARFSRHPAPPETTHAVHRSIVAVDIEGSTKRPNAVKGLPRNAMYALLWEALRAAGIGERICDRLVDRGDSALVLIHAADEVPKIRLLDTVVPALIGLLTRHNRQHADQSFRLRMVIHSGEVL